MRNKTLSIIVTLFVWLACQAESQNELPDMARSAYHTIVVLNEPMKGDVSELWTRPFADYPLFQLDQEVGSLADLRRVLKSCPKDYLKGYRIGEGRIIEGWILVSLDPQDSTSEASLWISGFAIKSGTDQLKCWGRW